MTARINEAKTLAKHISLDCKCKVDSTVCNSNQRWNINKCQNKCKKDRTCKKEYSYNPSTSIFENSSYLRSIVDN